MKVYDCFTFYNEFELLELRLKSLIELKVINPSLFILPNVGKNLKSSCRKFATYR